jgi:hypothetical protein
MSIEKSVTYFKELSGDNTDVTLKTALTRAVELGIRDIVVASTRGSTGLKTVEVFKGYNVVVVTHSAGFREPGVQSFPREIREKIYEVGGKVLTTGHGFAGVSRAVRRKFNTLGPSELVAHVLRMFGQGMKVCVECASMAADAGLIPMDRDIISIGGSGGGADTAIVIKPAHLHDVFESYIREVIAKPLRPRS